MSKQLRPISFLGPFFAVIAINKGFLRLLIILSKTMGRKRSHFDCLPHCYSKQIVNASHMIIQLEKDVVFHLISKIFSLSQIRSKMGTSSSHDLSIDSVEVFEDIFASTLSSQFSHSTPIKGTIHGKAEIVAVVNTFEVFDESASPGKY